MTQSMDCNATVRLRKEDYTIGWICALPVPELQVSRALLDGDEHEPLELDAMADPYTFGTMHGHNIVMACLPEIGNSAAASVVTAMRMAFPWLGVVLLVGIGGGVPSPEHDVRLGDVVVGIPEKDSRLPGVIRYDYGRAIHDGCFEMTGTVHPPPGRVLQAIGQIQSAPPKRLKFLGYLEQVKNIAPKPDVDLLFPPDYAHVAGETTCDQCSTHAAIPRSPSKPDHPEIFSGTIASADEVMRDGLKRERFQAEHPDIRCFEMEAGGVASNGPCLVVRGICDYCDSHKNKLWQPYAAAAAAAFAKEVLGKLPPRRSTPRPEQPIAQQVPASRALPITLLPFGRDEDFVGRTDVLDTIRSELFGHVDKHATVALWGLGGVGKSQIAIEYGWKAIEEDKQISVFWVHASTQARFEGALFSIADKLRLPGHDDPRADHARIACAWLASERSGRWMLIVDNADNSDFTRKQPRSDSDRPGLMIPQYLPQKQGCATLITSRDHVAASDLVQGSLLIEVKEMSEQEASSLLQRKIDRCHWNDVLMNQLVTKLDCIPLAITQAAAYIKQHGTMTISQYLERLEEVVLPDWPLSDSLNDSRRDLNVHDSVFKALEVSFARIEEKDANAARLLYSIAFLDRQVIPKALLSKLSKVSTREIDNAISILWQFCFLRSIELEDRAQTVYDTHRLVQLATLRRMHDRRIIQHSALEALRMAAHGYGDGEFKEWRMCRLLEPHAEAICAFLVELWSPKDEFHQWNRDHVGGTTALEDIRNLRADLMYRRSVYAYQQGDFWKAWKLGKLARSELQEVRGNDHPRTLACGALVARSCLATGDPGPLPQAIEICHDTYLRQAETMGPNDPETLTTQTHLAFMFQRQGHKDESIAILEQVVNSFMELPSDELMTTGAYQSLVMAANDLGILLGERGDHQESESLLTAVLHTFGEAIEENCPAILNLMANLAWSRLMTGRQHQGIAMLEDVLRKKRELLGPDHFEVLSTMESLGVAYEKQERHFDAYPLLQNAWKRSVEELGECHTTTLQRMLLYARSAHGLPDLYGALGILKTCIAFTSPQSGLHVSIHKDATSLLSRWEEQESRLRKFQKNGVCRVILGFRPRTNRRSRVVPLDS